MLNVSNTSGSLATSILVSTPAFEDRPLQLTFGGPSFFSLAFHQDVAPPAIHILAHVARCAPANPPERAIE